MPKFANFAHISQGAAALEELKLALILIAPAFVPIAGLFLTSRLIFKRKATLVEFYKFMPSESLLRQPGFWLSLLIPAFYFVGFGLIAWQGYYVSLTSQGLQTFISISTLPLALLSVAIPAAAIVASFHSTEQTAAQIRISSYYAHKNNFHSHLERAGEMDFFNCFKVVHNSHPQLYINYFSGRPEDGVPILNMERMREFEKMLSDARGYIYQILNAPSFDPVVVNLYLEKACPALRKIISSFSLVAIDYALSKRSRKYYYHGYKKTTIGNSTTDLVAVYRYALILYMDMCGAADYRSEDFQTSHRNTFFFEYSDEFLSMPSFNYVPRIHSEELYKFSTAEPPEL